MIRFCTLLLISGLILGGFNCNPSAEKMSEELSIEEQEPEYDLMEREIIKEANQYEKQGDLLQESEEDILEENVGDQIEK
jgi:endonuclease V-like protein UPF0215 family